MTGFRAFALLGRLVPRTVNHWTAIGTMVGAFGSIVGAAALIIGGFIAYDQWRSDRLMQLQERWASPEMVQRRTRLVDAFVCKVAPDMPDGKAPKTIGNVTGFRRYQDYGDGYWRDIVSPGPG